LLALAAVLVAFAVAVAFGNLHPLALALVTAGVASAAAGLAAGTGATPRARLAEVILGAGIAAGLLFGLVAAPGWYAAHGQFPGFRALLAVAGSLLATHLWPRAPGVVARWRLPALAAVWLALVALLLRAVPAPAIDVWDVQQGGAAALARGRDPYAAEYPNRYGPGTPLLAPGVLTADGRSIRAYPYPPLTLLAGLASLPLGDVRWIHAGLTVLSALGIWQLGQRSRLAELAAAFVLFQPRTLFVIEQAWTEPTVLLTLVGLALAVSRGVALPALAAGLALAAKQYVPLLLVPFVAAAAPARRWRIVALAALLAAALYLPFALWDPAALWRSLVTFHLVQPFRRDSLSLAAAVAAWGGPRLPAWPGFLAAAAVLATCWRGIRGPAAALAAGALAWLVLLLLAKQAFANYHWLAVGLLCAALAAQARGEERRPASLTEEGSPA
jgi:hypothetical protein